MKKKCISTNNAKSIDEVVTCVQETSCITYSCINPIQYILEKALENAILSNVSFDVALNILLTAGTVLPKENANGNDSGFCCPTANMCGLDGSGFLSAVYSLSNLTAFDTLAVALGWDWVLNIPLPPSALRPCCISVIGNTDINSEYLSLMQKPNPLGSADTILAPSCCNTPNRITCLDNLEMYINSNTLQSMGVIEVGGFLDNQHINLQSQICIIAAFIETVENSHYFATTPSAWITSFLNSGLTVFCCGCNIFIGNVSSLIDFQNNTNYQFTFPNGCNITNTSEG